MGRSIILVAGIMLPCPFLPRTGWPLGPESVNVRPYSDAHKQHRWFPMRATAFLSMATMGSYWRLPWGVLPDWNFCKRPLKSTVTFSMVVSSNFDTETMNMATRYSQHDIYDAYIIEAWYPSPYRWLLHRVSIIVEAVPLPPKRTRLAPTRHFRFRMSTNEYWKNSDNGIIHCHKISSDALISIKVSFFM